jgi:hypothetical protein
MERWLNNLSARCLLFAITLVLASQAGIEAKSNAADATFYVATNGRDTNQGTKKRPFETLARAKEAVKAARQRGKKPITVLVREGTYYQAEPLVFGPQDSGTANAPVSWLAESGKVVTISGGQKLKCKWKRHKKGIMKCELPQVKAGDLDFTQLFVNGRRQHRARYPNYDDSAIGWRGWSGYTYPLKEIEDDIPNPNPLPNDDMTYSGPSSRGIVYNRQTFTKKKWAHPAEAVIHILQEPHWGNLQWTVKAVDYDNHYIWFGHGGHQIGAKWTDGALRVDKGSQYYIENVFEELDAPGEWYLDKEKSILYYIPPKELDLKNALVEAPLLKQLIRFVGSQHQPVRNIRLEGFRITHTEATYLDKYEVPSLSDWAIHRGGTVFLEGARNITIKNCFFDAVGGNAVFMNNYNRNNIVTGCKFTEAGDSAVCFVGDLATTNGTQRDFPYECESTNNLIHDIGVFGKQVAGAYISRAKRIKVAHNLIYDTPRAGICIGDGTWGGHIIEYNHFRNTCRESGDHGPFNAWGRDKYWCLTQSHMPYTANRSHDAGLVKVDAMETVYVRNNFVQERRGWGIDMDDGASDYELYNNICVGVSFKLREGAYRDVYNNIWVDATEAPCAHVGYEDNHDRYHHNIVVMAEDDHFSFIAPPAKGPWLEEMDYNCFWKKDGTFSARVTEVRGKEGWPDENLQRYNLKQWREMGFDEHSVFADPMFVNPDNHDYRVKPNSPALKLGFKNFEMGKWGLTDEFPKMWLD